MTKEARPIADRRILCPVLIGREAELGRLDALLRESLGGRGHTVLVSGEAGVGKTALVRDFVRQAHALGAGVFSGECTELDARRPFGPFMEIARAANRVAALRVASADAVTPGADRYRLYPAFASLLADLARERPIVIVIEDLHWADEASLELFPHLARKLRDAPLLLIGTYRTDELHRRHPLRPVLADLSRSRLADDITLPRLSEDGVAAFLSEAMRLGRPPTPEFRQAIHRTCEGNPLFMEEVLRALAERGDVELRDGVWLRTKGVAEIAIPDTLRDAVLERFNSLSAESQGVLRQAAVIGQRFDFDLLIRITGESEETIVAALRAAIDAQLLQEVAKDDGSEQYAFRHALTRESILLDLLGRELRRIHAAVGEAIESRAGDSSAAYAEDLAYHFDEAGDAKRASLYHEMAANESLRVFAYRRVVEHLDRVVALAANGDPSLADALLKLAEAARGADDETRCVRGAMDARELFARAGDRRREADALVVAASGYANLRDYERALATAGEAARILEPHGESSSLAAAYGDIARTAMFMGDYARSITSGERAVAMARSVGATDVQLHAEVTLGTSLARQAGDRRAEGIRRIRSAIESGIAQRAFLATDRGLVNLCDVLRSRAPADAQRTATAEYVTWARMHGSPTVTALCSEADLPLVDGDWDSVLRIAAESAGEGHYADWLQLKEAFVRVGRSGPGAGLPLIEAPRRRLALLAWSMRVQEAVLISQIFALAGEHAKVLGFAEDYAATVGSGNPDLPLDGLTLCAILAARASGDQSAVQRWIGLALDAPQLLPPQFDAQRAYATAEHRASQGDIDGALVSLDESARIFADAFIFDSVFPLTAIGLRRTELLLERGHSGAIVAANAEFALLLPYWRKAKATWYLEQLKSWAGQRGLAYPGEPSADTGAPRSRAALTSREREVAGLVARGLSNKDIAAKLVISERTAEGHVERILGKLGFRSRAQIASWQAGGDPTARLS